ncbi:hypothetical protein [Peribacillus sp. TH24]|uniref:hypothetical protein n=1 Tax=Peribacillus sp. TH24 TaxID=2798483 RepID=UPI001914B4BC|nr:hypothetical protein [Peribacillus sp. TH24]MBK5443532.1 hypothetical protein [Peribacillus sp. TH24]
MKPIYFLARFLTVSWLFLEKAVTIFSLMKIGNSFQGFPHSYTRDLDQEMVVSPKA